MITYEDLSFYVVGAQRCATTWLHAALREHPDIFVPQEKQIHYFDKNFDRGPDWHLSHFQDADPSHQIIGEVSSSYCLPDALPRLSDMTGHVKVILCVRNPVERAISFYRSRALSNGWRSFNEAIQHEPTILARGYYDEILTDLRVTFGEDNVLTAFYDDLRHSADSYLFSVYSFLGVDPHFSPSILHSPMYLTMPVTIRSFLERGRISARLRWIDQQLTKGNLRRAYFHLKTNGLAKGFISPMKDERSWLVSHYRPHNEKLSMLLSRNLDCWSEI